MFFIYFTHMYNAYELSKKKHCVTRRDQLHSGTRCGEGSRRRRWDSGAGDRRGHDPDPAQHTKVMVKREH